MSDAITRVTGNVTFVAANLAIFAAWIVLNTWGVGTLPPFDPFPFSLLTLVVSLEAIFLAIFVLMSQNRMARAADKRAHLDLQVDLLAEQELTTMLRMLHALCAKLRVDVDVDNEQMQDLLRDTDVDKLANALDRRMPAS